MGKKHSISAFSHFCNKVLDIVTISLTAVVKLSEFFPHRETKFLYSKRFIYCNLGMSFTGLFGISGSWLRGRCSKWQILLIRWGNIQCFHKKPSAKPEVLQLFLFETHLFLVRYQLSHAVVLKVIWRWLLPLFYHCGSYSHSQFLNFWIFPPPPPPPVYSG